jgi:predicted phosphate transport protein (TIGR00153 family)
MVLAKFLPKDEEFFGFFADAAANAAEAATVLSRILAADTAADEMARQVGRLRDIEHRGDEISHGVFRALHSTFVTPLDRDDIQHLTSAIDTFVDRIDEVGTRFHLYKLGPATELASRFARLVVEQAAAIQPVIPMLEHANKHGREIRDAILTIHRLENEGDDLLNAALASLYDGVTEISELISCLRWGELYQLLEDVTDSAEDVADVFEGIMITYA